MRVNGANGNSPPARATHCPRRHRIPLSVARRSNSRASRVFPTPASPATMQSDGRALASLGEQVGDHFELTQAPDERWA